MIFSNYTPNPVIDVRPRWQRYMLLTFCQGNKKL